MNKRRRFKAKRNRRENKMIMDYRNRMRSLDKLVKEIQYSLKIEIK